MSLSNTYMHIEFITVHVDDFPSVLKARTVDQFKKKKKKIIIIYLQRCHKSESNKSRSA